LLVLQAREDFALIGGQYVRDFHPCLQPDFPGRRAVLGNFLMVVGRDFRIGFGAEKGEDQGLLFRGQAQLIGQEIEAALEGLGRNSGGVELRISGLWGVVEVLRVEGGQSQGEEYGESDSPSHPSSHPGSTHGGIKAEKRTGKRGKGGLFYAPLFFGNVK